MKSHLSHILPWELLVKNYYVNNSDCLILPVCKCNKMHIIKKSNEIKIQNRKYIKDEQLCRDVNCNEIGEKKFYKNENKIKFVMNSSLDNNLSNISKYDRALNVKNFLKIYSETLNTFANDYLQKLLNIKKNKKFKLNDNYKKENIEEYLINKIKEYYVLDKDTECKYKKENCNSPRIHKQRLDTYGSVSQYEFVYALISSDNDDNDNDIIYLLDEIDKFKKDNSTGLSIYDVISESGTQCYGRYANHIMEIMNTFYIKVNTIIASGNFSDKKVWEKLNNMSICLSGDFHDFVPKWLHEHFYMDKLNINFLDCIRTENLNELLKKIFKYNYVWLALHKYANDKRIKSMGYSIFFNITDFNYYYEDLQKKNENGCKEFIQSDYDDFDNDGLDY